MGFAASCGTLAYAYTTHNQLVYRPRIQLQTRLVCETTDVYSARSPVINKVKNVAQQGRTRPHAAEEEGPTRERASPAQHLGALTG